jgi:hypothetical protein
MIEAIAITMQGVGYAAFNSVFFMGLGFIYMLNKRLSVLDFYRTRSFKPFVFKLADIILEGILIGLMTSVVLVIIGVPLYFNEILLLLTPLALILGIFRIRMMCITYAAAVFSLISLAFNEREILGINFPNLELHVPSLFILVGLLHLIEGALILLTAERTAVPIISSKENKIIMGHIIQKNWLVPLSILVIQLGVIATGGVEMPSWWPLIVFKTENPFYYTLLPLVGFLSYSTITYSDTPRKRSTISGLSIMLFGSCIIGVGIISQQSIILQYMGCILMFVLHEGVYLFERYRENHQQPIYTLPQTGIRIMQIIEGGLGDKLGMQKGDVIEKINDIVIKDIQHFIHLIKEAKDQVVIATKTLAGKNINYNVNEIERLDQFGIRVIPEKPLIIYPYNELNDIGLFDFIRRKERE